MPIYFLFISMTTYSCLSFKPLEVTEIESVKLNTNGREKACLDIHLKIKNENLYPIKIKRGKIRCNIGNLTVGEAVVKEKIKIPKKSESSHPFRVNIDALNLVLSLPGMLISGQYKVSLNGTLHAKVILFSKKVNLQLEKPILKFNN